MAEAKTKPTKQTVKDFISKLPDKQTRDDCAVIARLMEEATKQKGVMWGPSIVGFGLTTIKYAGGREADGPRLRFHPASRVASPARVSRKAELLAKLGKHKLSGCCLYIKRLTDVDLPTLKKLIGAEVKKKKR
jgi:hypothetical protein